MPIGEYMKETQTIDTNVVADNTKNTETVSQTENNISNLSTDENKNPNKNKKRFPKINKKPNSNSKPNLNNNSSSENSFNPTNNKPKSQKPKFFKKNTRHDIDDTVVNEIESEEDKLIYSLYKLTRAKTLNIAEFSDNFFEYKFKYKKDPIYKSKTLLHFAFLYENDLVFNFLIKNSDSSRDEIKNNLQFLFSNKNPDILKTCLNHSDLIQLTPEQSTNLFKNIAQHVFRLENIYYILDKFSNLNINQKQEFISALFEYNNIPMIKGVNQFEHLKPLAFAYFDIHKELPSMQNYALIYTQIFKQETQKDYFFPSNNIFTESTNEFNQFLQTNPKTLYVENSDKDLVKEINQDLKPAINSNVMITKKTILKRIKP